MNITLDGAQALNIPDLSAAWAASVKYTDGTTVPSTPPAAGGYGMRAGATGSCASSR